MSRPNLRRYAILAPLPLLVASLLAWAASFFYYPLLAHEAYSGIGTEFMVVRGVAIFYHYNSYTRELPPQDWGISAIPAGSRMGQRVTREFDMSKAPSWANRRGFRAVSRPEFGPGTSMVLLALPMWFIALVLVAAPAATLFCTRRKESRDGAAARIDQN